MHRTGSSLLAAIVLACCGATAHAAGTPSVTVGATNVTLASSSTVSFTTFTLTSVNGYTGTFVLSCQYSGPQTMKHLPYCGGGTARAWQLKANQSVNGNLPITPSPVPTARQSPGPSLPNRAPVFAVALAALLFLRPRFRRAGWLSMCFLAAAIVVSIASCGGGGVSGNYPYTVTATDTNTQAQVSTHFTITIQ